MFDGLEVILNRKCWVEKKLKREEKGRTIFESMHCYSPTTPIGRHRPKKATNMVPMK